MWIRRAVTLLLPALLLLGCGDDDGEASSATVPAAGADADADATTEATTTTEDPDAALEAEIEQAYHAQWDAFVEILSDPDPTNPLIDEHFAGAAKETLLDAISTDRRDGIITRLPDNPSDFAPTLERIELENDHVLVTECLVDGLVAIERASGQVIDDDVVILRLINRFERVDGSWKVTSTRVLEELSGRDQCVAS